MHQIPTIQCRQPTAAAERSVQANASRWALVSCAVYLREIMFA